MTAVGVIPARGGSKGVPRKNLASVGGEPLVARAARIACEARLLDRVVVSTDDEEIAAVAAAAGAEVVERPAEISGDEASTEAALLHALDALGDEDPTWTVTLEPTSPLRTAELIDRCVLFAEERVANAVITVSAVADVLGNVADGVFTPLSPDAPRRRQLREPLFRETGTVYVTRTAHLRRTGSVLATPLHALVVPRELAVDVNDAFDLVLADAMIAESAR